MKNGQGCLVALGIFAVCAAIGSLLPEKEETPAQKVAIAKAHNEAAIERSVKSILKDPDSSQFRHLGEHCGWVNAKNSFGGYTGFTRFIANPDADAALETDDNHPEFEKLWHEKCLSIPG